MISGKYCVCLLLCVKKKHIFYIVFNFKQKFDLVDIIYGLLDGNSSVDHSICRKKIYMSKAYMNDAGLGSEKCGILKYIT